MKAAIAFGLALALAACGPAQHAPMSPHASQETGLIRASFETISDVRLPWKIMLGITASIPNVPPRMLGVAVVKQGFLTEKECTAGMNSAKNKARFATMEKDMTEKLGVSIKLFPVCLDESKIKDDIGDAPGNGESL